MIRVQLNTVDAGDDPENRYDCDHCLYAPEPTEHIVLIVDQNNSIQHKLCLRCAEIGLVLTATGLDPDDFDAGIPFYGEGG